MQIIQKFIEKLGALPAERAGIYLSSDSKMELVIYNVETGEIRRNAKVDFEYNQTLREINIDSFGASLNMLIAKADVPQGCPVYISLPNILTAIKAFPSDLEEIELDVAISSEGEKSYIFKKAEPKVSWNLLSENPENLTKTYVYSIIQMAQAEKIEEICRNNNINLIAIDTAFASLLRGMTASGILSENFQNHLKWCIVIISPNNYLIAKFEGDKLLNIIENPLALRSIEPDVLYTTLNTTISEKLQYEKLSNIYIVSQAVDFTAKKLASCTKLISNIHTIDNHKYDGNALFMHDSSNLEPISLECIGAAVWKKSQMNLNFNFSSSENQDEIKGFLGNMGVKKLFHVYLVFGIAAALILTGVISFFLFATNLLLTTRIDEYSRQSEQLEKFNIASDKEFNQNDFVTSAYEQNLDVVSSYDVIGAVIPEKIWLDSFLINDKLLVRIKGKAYSVEDIITYFENLQKVSKFKNLKIKEINIAGEDNTKTESTPSAQDGSKALVMLENTDGMALPPPPMPNASSSSGSSLKAPSGGGKGYYEFTFENIELSDIQETLLKTLPEFIRDTVFPGITLPKEENKDGNTAPTPTPAPTQEVKQEDSQETQ
jgi:Tfp pilus assembly protein PilN